MSLHTFPPEPIENTRGFVVVAIHEADNDMYASAQVYDGLPGNTDFQSEHQDTTTARVREWAKRYARRFLPLDGAQSSCNNCSEEIEFNSGNEPPWTHTETGFSDCGDDHEGFHAEPGSYP